MRHREAIKYLTDLGSGALEPAKESELRSHLNDCPDCRDWLAIRDLLAVELAPHEGPEEEHPDSELLALCVIRPEEIHEPERETLRAHLTQCASCRRELDLVTCAVKQARQGHEPPTRHGLYGLSVPRRPRAPKTLLAAGLAILTFATAILLGALLGDRFNIPMSEPRDRHVAETITPPDTFQELTGQDLEGSQVIESEETLLVSKLRLKSGADVVFRGRGTVAFGDGFQVGEGARMAVSSESKSVNRRPGKTLRAPRSRKTPATEN